MKASLNNYRQAPRKVRLITDSVKGKRVEVALVELTHAQKKGADQIKKLVASAVANAKVQDSGLNVAELVIKNITVDQGVTLRRFRPRARGRAAPINHESSHVRVVLMKAAVKEKVREVSGKEEAAAPKAAKKSAKMAPKAETTE